MEIVLVIIGGFISSLSLVVILFGKKKRRDIDNPEFSELELEYRDLKNQILDLMKEFNRSANFNTNLLDEKIVYINEMREDVDNKMLKLSKMMTDMEILYNRFEKAKQEVPILQNEAKEDKVIKMKPKISKLAGIDDSDVVEMYNSGMTKLEISEKTGKSLGEIEFVLGLRRMRC